MCSSVISMPADAIACKQSTGILMNVLGEELTSGPHLSSFVSAISNILDADWKPNLAAFVEKGHKQVYDFFPKVNKISRFIIIMYFSTFIQKLQ